MKLRAKSLGRIRQPYLIFPAFQPGLKFLLDYMGFRPVLFENFRNHELCEKVVRFFIREVKLDVYGKRQTAKIKLLPSVFSSLYSRIKIFVFAVNSKRHFSIFV